LLRHLAKYHFLVDIHVLIVAPSFTK
jgi:hypothetical protein